MTRYERRKNGTKPYKVLRSLKEKKITMDVTTTSLRTSSDVMTANTFTKQIN